MTEVAPTFVERPDIPEAGSQEEDRWAKQSTIAFEGGYVEAAYGNLIQTWNTTAIGTSCASINVDRAGYTVDRELQIGMGSKEVVYAPKTYKRFPRRNGSAAAGGEEFTMVTDVGEYTARVGGDVQTFIDWVCTNKDKQYGTLEIYSNRGAHYGPFGI